MSVATGEGSLGPQDDSCKLLQRAQAGDRAAAERLVEESYAMVYASLCRLTGGDRELAADLTQETYQKAWQALQRFDGRASLKSWLYRIAYNTFLNHIRRPARVRVFDDDQEEAAVADSRPMPDAGIAERQENERLRRAVLGLPPDLRFVVTARFFRELSVRDIAQLEGLTPMGIRKRLRRALVALELKLGEKGSSEKGGIR